jgi:hypothetical protein
MAPPPGGDQASSLQDAREDLRSSSDRVGGEKTRP